MGTKATALEFLLSRKLHFDRVAPVQRFGDLYGLGRRVIFATAGVQAERSSRVGDVYPDALLLDASNPRARHLGVDRRLSARPDLQNPVFAHAAHGVVRL